MSYTNDDIFNVKYNKEIDRLEIQKKSKMKQILKNHKFFATVMALFIVFSLLNVILIYNFLEILKNI